MNIAFYDTKPYDKIWFEPLASGGESGCRIKFYEHKLNADTAISAKDYDCVCAFVNDRLDRETIGTLHGNGVKLIAMRCAGYNNVDIAAAYGKIHVVRVPAYSPASVAEHAAALLLSVNRKIHRAYVRTRDNNFNINGLMGIDLSGKTAGVIGTGKIGRLFINICRGLGMRVIAYDAYPVQDSGIDYVSLDELLEKSDVISLHCPLTAETHHMIGKAAIEKMKPGVLLVNTSRGGLVDTSALLDGLKAKQIGGAGLDVYEEESDYFFEDWSNETILDDELARLLTFPNVLMTSHQGFFTQEAMREIAAVTMENIRAFENGERLENEICYKCEKECVKKAGSKKCF